MESSAIADFEKTMFLKVKPCGLYCDLEYPFLGVSPGNIKNRLIYNNALLPMFFIKKK